MKSALLNRAIRTLLGTNGLILVSGAMLGPIYALFVKDIGGDLLDASYTFAIFALAAGVTTLLSGRFADSFKESELIVVAGYFIIGIGFLGYAFVDSIAELFLVQIVIGFGEAIYSPAFDALYSKHLEPALSGSMWGTWEAMNYFTLAFGSAAGGLLVATFGFSTLVMTMAFMCFASALYIGLLPREAL